MRSRTNNFGSYLREKRTVARKTLGDVARALNCTVSFVSDVEHGRRNPFDREQIQKVAELLNVSAFELAVAAAKDRQSVSIVSDRDEHLEMAASFARVIERGDPERISQLRALMENFLHDEENSGAE